MSAVEDYSKMSDSAKKKEDWMNSKWRPMMGWMYMVVCITDFVIFPILWSLVQVVGDGKVESQWIPITLQGAGLFHIAMGAILGIAAYGRTQEKMSGTNLGSPAPSFGSPAPGFGSHTTGFGSPAPSFGSPAPRSYTPASSFGNAPMGNNTVSSAGSFGRGPMQPDHPEI